MNRIQIELTDTQLGNVIDFIETEFIDSIRRDESVDNIDYVIDMMNALQIMRFAAYRNRGRCAEAYLCQFN